MPIFEYKAKDKSGKVVQDTLQATNKEEAATILKSSQLQILTLRDLEAKGTKSSVRISVADKAIFCRFMATMLRSGMSIPEALEIIKAETTKKGMKKVIEDLAYQTQKGKSLSSILAEYKDSFDPIFLTMVKVGEESGTLEKSFDYLTKQLTASHDLSQKVKGSMMYPAVIVVAMMGNGLVMALFVLPRIASVFLKLDVPLPLPTQIVLGVGDFIGKNVVLTLGIMVAMGVVAFLIVYLRATRTILMRYLVKLPVVKKIVQQIDIARFARTLSTLLRSGVPITTSLDVAANGISDIHARTQAKKFSADIARGESLSAVIDRNTKLFPPILIQSIKAGEKTGSLEDILQEMANFYESEVEYSLKNATALLEPVLMLTIGLAVGFMVLIMIAPIYGIIGGLQQQIGGGGR